MAQFNGPGQASTQSTTAIISEGIVVTGNVTCDGNLQISGRVDGEVRGKAVFIDETGVVEGAVAADQLRVCGAVTGEVAVTDLAIEPGGSVSGDTAYQRMKVASGAVLQGTLTHRPAAGTATGSGDGETSLKLVQPAAPVNPRHVFVD